MSPSEIGTFTTTSREDGIVVVHVDGMIGGENRQVLKQLVLDALAIPGTRRIVLDCALCTYIDSSGLGALVSIVRRCREARADFVVAALNEDLRELMRTTALDVLLELLDTVDRAVAA
jgi:anti-sigma B factor antagonist